MAMILVSRTEIAGSSAANIEFTNIPQSGKDLFLIMSIRNGSTTDRVDYYINGAVTDSAKALRGSGSAVLSNTSSTTYFGNDNAYTANTFSTTEMHITDYSQAVLSPIFFDSVQENNAALAYQFLVAGTQLVPAAAITSLRFTASGDFLPGSSIALYLIN